MAKREQLLTIAIKARFLFINFLADLGNDQTMGFWKHCYFGRNVSWILLWKLPLRCSCNTSASHALFSNSSLKGNVQRWTWDKLRLRKSLWDISLRWDCELPSDGGREGRSSWAYTQVSEKVSSQEPCIDQPGLSVTKMCLLPLWNSSFLYNFSL